MRAIEYTAAGGPEVLHLGERDMPFPGPGEVRVQVAYSGVNPTDWKSRSTAEPPAGWQIPDQDGAGLVDEVGEGVEKELVGTRVWLWESAHERPWGTAAQYTLARLSRTVPLADEASFELGASLGVPFITAHRCLTVGEGMPDRLGPGTLQGRTVLVQGGAGAVGNAAIQLARWSDATVITTVSTAEKGLLAAAAGADHIVNYRDEDVTTRVRAVVPAGVDVVVEVNAKANAGHDAAVLSQGGTVAMYGAEPDDEFTLKVRDQMRLNSRWQFVLLYTAPEHAKRAAVDDITAALFQDAIGVGEGRGLPLLRFDLADTAAAHQAVQDGAIGKVLIDARS